MRRCAGAPCQGRDQPERPLWRAQPGTGQNVKGQNDQTVTGQHRKRFGKGTVQPGFAPPQVGIIKGGQVVMDKAAQWISPSAAAATSDRSGRSLARVWAGSPQRSGWPLWGVRSPWWKALTARAARRAVATDTGPTDTEPTVLTSPHLAEDLLALCGRRAGDMVEITALPELARHWWPDGSRLDLAPDADANAAGRGVLC